jgi:hypothetical protein
MQSSGAIEAALDWQEALDLGVSKLSFEIDDSEEQFWIYILRFFQSRSHGQDLNLETFISS